MTQSARSTWHEKHVEMYGDETYWHTKIDAPQQGPMESEAAQEGRETAADVTEALKAWIEAQSPSKLSSIEKNPSLANAVDAPAWYAAMRQSKEKNAVSKWHKMLTDTYQTTHAVINTQDATSAYGHDGRFAPPRNVFYEPEATKTCCLTICGHQSSSDVTVDGVGINAEACRAGCKMWLHHSSLNWEHQSWHPLLKERCLGRYQDQSGQDRCKTQVTCGAGEGFSGTIQQRGTCSGCPAGEYQDSGSHQEACKTQTTCGTGEQFSGTPDESGSCQACQLGEYQASASHRLACDTHGACPTGTRYIWKDHTNDVNAVCAACAAGRYQDQVLTHSTSCKACGAGEYQDSTKESSCKACSAGLHQDQTMQAACKVCGTGQYQDQGQQAGCKQCGFGHYQDQQAQSGCKACPAGTYQHQLRQAALAACNTCPPGQYQPAAGQQWCRPCALGAYTDQAAQASCKLCGTGHFQDQTYGISCKQCGFGHYQDQQAQSGCKACPAGTYQHQLRQAALAACNTCPPGQYQPAAGQQWCRPCALGAYTDQAAQASCKLCDTGHFQDQTYQASCKVCPAGQFSRRRTDFKGCDSCATWSQWSNRRRAVLCAKGSGWCTHSGASNTQRVCNGIPGNFCRDANGGAGFAPCSGQPQPSGSVWPTGACSSYGLGADACQTNTCQPGKYSNGQDSCVACASGQYQDQGLQTGCKVCPAGQFSRRRTDFKGCDSCATWLQWSNRRRRAADNCQTNTCQPGKYSNGQDSCVACASGQYQDQGQQAGCKQCGFGHYQDQQAQSGCKACPAGTYQHQLRQAALAACNACPPGQYQPAAGQQWCRPCALGAYTDQAAQASCKLCGTGRYQDQAYKAGCKVCNVGMYQSSAKQAACISCDVGKYQDSPGQSACRHCGVGTVPSANSARCERLSVISVNCTSHVVLAGEQRECVLVGLQGTLKRETGLHAWARWVDRNELGVSQSCQGLGEPLKAGPGWSQLDANGTVAWSAADMAFAADTCGDESMPRLYSGGEDASLACANQTKDASGVSVGDPARCCVAVDPAGASNASQPLSFRDKRFRLCVKLARSGEVLTGDVTAGWLGGTIIRFVPDRGDGGAACIAACRATAGCVAGAWSLGDTGCNIFSAITDSNTDTRWQMWRPAISPWGNNTVLLDAEHRDHAGRVPGRLHAFVAPDMTERAQRAWRSPTGGTQLTLFGRGGRFDTGANVTFRFVSGASRDAHMDVSAPGVKSFDHGAELRFTTPKVPPTAHDSRNVEVLVKTRHGNSTHLFTYAPPVLETLFPRVEVVSSSPPILTLQGYNLGSGAADSLAKPCKVWEEWSNWEVCDLKTRTRKRWRAVEAWPSDESGSALKREQMAKSECRPDPGGQWMEEACTPQCEPGYGYTSARCEPCKLEAGQFSDTAGDEPCKWLGNCAEDNRYEVAKPVTALDSESEVCVADRQCGPCPAGHECPRGQQKIACGPGRKQVSSAEGNKCQPCDAGEYQSQGGQTACIACAPGRYQHGRGQESCTECSAGMYQTLSRRSECAACQVGQWSTAHAAACIACPVGFFGGISGKTSPAHCAECPKGKFQDKQGQPECKDCDYGRYNDQPGQTAEGDCKLCAAGKHNSELRSTHKDACKDCPETTESVAEGQKECERTPCPPGKWKQGDLACRVCSPGTYTTAQEQPSCAGQLCPSGKYGAHGSTSDGSCKTCPAGKYTDKLGQDACVGAACPLGQYYAYGSDSAPTTAVTCKDCPAGKYADEEGQSSCKGKSCSAGKWFPPGSGTSVDCISCAVGKYHDEAGQGTECKDCPEGKYGEELDKCKNCPAGQYLDLATKSAVEDCKTCARGRYSEQVAQTSARQCQACAVGMFQNTSYERRNPQSSGDNCEDCPVGMYQDATAASDCQPCSAGTFNNLKRQTSQSACKSCLIGQYQDAWEKGECKDCERGQYAQKQGSVECTLCPANKFQNYPKKSACKPCSAGQHQPAEGQLLCQNDVKCPPDYSRDSNHPAPCSCAGVSHEKWGGDSDCASLYFDKPFCYVRLDAGCPDQKSGVVAGFDRAGTFLWSYDACSQCMKTNAARRYLAAGPGKRRLASSSRDAETAVSSTAATSRTLVRVDGKPCAIQPGATNEQIICAMSQNSGSAPMKVTVSVHEQKTTAGDEFRFLAAKCKQGTGLNRDDNTCATCAEGQYSDEESIETCALCAPGQYQDRQQQTRCKGAPAGKYQLRPGKVAADPCPFGTFSNVTGADECQECPAGQYNDREGQTLCKYCAAGHAAAGSRTKTCVECAPGKYQASMGSTSCHECDTGTYANATRGTRCDGCEAGKYQPNTGRTACELCAAGKKGDGSDQSSLTYCTDCTAGQYSATGAAGCTHCPAGRHQPEKGMKTCQACGETVDKESEYQNGAGKTACKACQPGAYRASATSCIECPPGVKCPDGAKQTPCNHNSTQFQDEAGQTACKSCAADKSYRPFGRRTSCRQKQTCHAGTKEISAGSATADRGCAECAAGMYTDQKGLHSCKTCPQGKYQEETGQTSCEVCRAGKAGSSAVNTTSWTHCEACTPGQSQPKDGESSCANCTAGTFAATEGATMCAECPGGKYAARKAQVQCADCAEGHVALGNRSTLCRACAVGQYRKNPRACDDCKDGHYQDEPAQSSCKRCKTCGGSRQRQACKQSFEGFCVPCSPGSYIAHSGACTKCPRGMFAVSTTATACTNCTRGQYQPVAGQTSCMPHTACQAGESVETPGTAISDHACARCRPGTFARIPGRSVCSDCAAGHYAIQNGSIACMPCAAGKYGNASHAGAATAAHCTVCAPGRFQTTTGATSCHACRPGHHCSRGTQMRCRAGTFQPNASATECMQCAPGRYDNGTGHVGGYVHFLGRIDCNRTCPKRHFCPGGTHEPLQCDGALFCPEGSSLPQPVLPGEILREDGVKETCPRGYFCNMGNVNGTVGGLQIASAALEVSGIAASTMTSEELREWVASAMNKSLDHVWVNAATQDGSNVTVLEIEAFVPPSDISAMREWMDSNAFEDGIAQRLGADSASHLVDPKTDAWRGKCKRGFVLTLGATGALACTPCTKRQTYCPTVGHIGDAVIVGVGNYSVQVAEREVDQTTQTVSVGEQPCEPGYYCAAGERAKCPLGTYEDEHASLRCKPCKAPYFGNITGLDKKTCSGRCPPRRECIGGTMLPDRCQLNEVVEGDSARCARCKPDHFAFHSDLYMRWAAEITGNDTCIKCPHTPHDEATCLGGLLRFQQGYWHSGISWINLANQTRLSHATKESFTNTELAFYPCPCKACCEVDALTGSVSCSPGNSGALCAVCRPDYYKRTDTGACVACENVNMSQDVPWVALLVLALFLLFFLGSDARAEWRCLRRVQKHVQGCRQVLVGKSKIVLSFFQIMLLTKNIYRVPFPVNFVDFMDKLAFLRFELFKLVPVRCLYAYSFHDILDATVIFSVIFTLPPWFKLLQEYNVWGRLCGRTACWTHTQARLASVIGRRDTRTGELLNTLVAWLLVITYLLYPTMSSLLFQTFSCETVHLGRFLHQDYAIDCDGAEHARYEAIASVMIAIFAVGVPMLFWALLRRHRHNLVHEHAQYLRFFFADYKPQFWYWEVIECFRKLTLTGVALFFGAQGSLLQTAVSVGLMMLYIPVLIYAQPYALPSDNHVAQLVNVGLVFVLFSSLLLKVETSFESTGRFELGYSEETLGALLIAVAIVVLVVWCFAFVYDVRRFNLRQSFRFKSSGCLLTMPVLDGVSKTYHAFISHSQQDGGDQVANLKKELEKYIGTINIFTDVAAGKQERALTQKSQLYTAIERSEVFLVFLTRTFFTRKWCVKEFQEASATGKHIVLVLDSDPRHGGMTAKEFAAYAAGQRARAAADAETKASNLWNQGALEGDHECTRLCEWVASHVSAAAGRLVIDAFDYAGGSDAAAAIAVPRRSYPVVPWYRYAREKRVALQLIAEAMITAPTWGYPRENRVLALPSPRPRAAPLPPGRYHACLSAAHGASNTLRQRLEAFCPALRVLVAGGALRAEQAAQCDAVIVLSSNDAPSAATPAAASQLVMDGAYQADLRTALDAGLRVVLVHDCSLPFGALQPALWEQAEAAPGGGGAGKVGGRGAGAGRFAGVLRAEHLQRLFDPIAIYCQPALLYPGRAAASDHWGGVAGSGEHGVGTAGFDAAGRAAVLFDESTLLQVVDKCGSPAGASAGLAALCRQAAARARHVCPRGGTPRRGRFQAAGVRGWSVFGGALDKEGASGGKEGAAGAEPTQINPIFSSGSSAVLQGALPRHHTSESLEDVYTAAGAGARGTRPVGRPSLGGIEGVEQVEESGGGSGRGSTVGAGVVAQAQPAKPGLKSLSANNLKSAASSAHL